jgi:hypothetical protein
MFGAWLKLLTFPDRPTGRTLRLLSCHPRLTSPFALPGTFGLAKTSDELQRNAISVIAIASRLIDARTCLRHAVSAPMNSSRTAFPATISKA